MSSLVADLVALQYRESSFVAGGLWPDAWHGVKGDNSGIF